MGRFTRALLSARIALAIAVASPGVKALARTWMMPPWASMATLTIRFQ